VTHQNPPQQIVKESRQLAKTHGLSISQKGDKFFIFRHIAGRGICVGSCGIAALFRKVSRLAATH